MTDNVTKSVKSEPTVNEEYLGKIFTILKKMESFNFSNSRRKFNHSEMRLIGEVVDTKQAGRRIISTQLARRLGITRSAVSQMVNKLEKRGIIRRLPDDVDRKIVYVELTEEAEAHYLEEKKAFCEYVGKLLEKFGQENFDQMYALINEFFTSVEAVKQ